MPFPTTETALRELRQQDLLRAPCGGCGAQLVFRAETQQLACTHCGATEVLPLGQARLHENALHSDMLSQELPLDRTVEEQLFCCPGCGARTRVSAEAPTLSCGFCGNGAINPEAQRTRLIAPAGVLPFRVARPGAEAAFRGWIGGSWLAPGDLRAGSVLHNLHGIYLPFWTFDAQAHSRWSGERGTHYYETESYTDSKGQRATRSVRRTRWSYHSGTHDEFYDDVLLLASTSLQAPAEALDEVQDDFDLAAVVDYDPRLLLGWEAEVYAVDLQAGVAQAHAIMKEHETAACSNELGGDEQRGLEVTTRFSAETYKHLLLPLWLCAYVYQGKTYHFLVNGQTGRISGSRPVSAWKVALLVLLGLLLAAGAWWLWQRYRQA